MGVGLHLQISWNHNRVVGVLVMCVGSNLELRGTVMTPHCSRAFFHATNSRSITPPQKIYYMDNKDSSESHDAQVFWRELTAIDVEALLRIAAQIHPGLPESAEVFAERINLFPQGCLALVNTKTGILVGYAISHPIKYRQPPALDTLLGHVALGAEEYYIHDVAILSEYRGRGYARECIRKLFAVAARYRSVCLVSVYDTAAFWAGYGFLPVECDVKVAMKVKGYGHDAVYLERMTKITTE